MLNVSDNHHRLWRNIPSVVWYWVTTASERIFHFTASALIRFVTVIIVKRPRSITRCPILITECISRTLMKVLYRSPLTQAWTRLGTVTAGWFEGCSKCLRRSRTSAYITAENNISNIHIVHVFRIVLAAIKRGILIWLGSWMGGCSKFGCV